MRKVGISVAIGAAVEDELELLRVVAAQIQALVRRSE